MKRLFITLLVLISVSKADFATDLDLASGDVITIGGDSGTSEHKWPHYFAAWLQLTYPHLDLKTYTHARSGTNLKGWNSTDGSTPPIVAPNVSEWERLHAPFDPDLVVLMHGYNGAQTAAEHGAEYESFYQNWIGSGRKLLCMGMYPSQDATDVRGAEAKSAAEAAFAADHANVWSSSQFAEHGARWLANHANGIDIVQLDAIFAPGDTGGHYGPAGHVVTTWALLTNLGVETVVSAATLNATTNTETSSANCTISNLALTASGGTFDRLDGSLPWAIDEEGRENATALISELAGWQDYSITITGLTSGTYTIKCDGVVIGTATHTELAAGWNMADLTTGPVWEQCQSVLTALRVLQGVNTTTGIALGGSVNTGTIGDVKDYSGVYYTSGGQRGATYLTSMATQGTGGGPVGRLATNMSAVHAAAQPVTRTYLIEGETGAAPVVTITTPASPATVDVGTSINFVATATDTEDGNIAANVVWTSTLDGALGTGASITPTLSLGFHTITATSTDSDDNVSFATTTATVESVAVESSYDSPRGIPAPMWGSLDPIMAYAPSTPGGWPGTVATGYYYVDSSHGSATDSANTYGTPNLPRLTVPGTLAAGSKVFIARTATNIDLTAATGTESEPVWLVGVSGGLVETAATGTTLSVSGSSAYVFIDGLTLDGSGISQSATSKGIGINNGANHIIVRNCIVRDYPGPSWNGTDGPNWTSSLNTIQATTPTASVSDIIFHNFTCTGNAGGQASDFEKGQHAIHILSGIDGTYTTSNIWILDSTLSDNAEDGIQIGQTNPSTVREGLSPVYIGRCNINANGENAIDLKACGLIVVSETSMTDYVPTTYREGATSGSDGTACVLNDDGNGPLETWWLFNDLSDTTSAFRLQNSGGDHYFLGNISRNLSYTVTTPDDTADGYGKFIWSSSGANIHAHNNSISNVEGGFVCQNVGAYLASGNIVSGITQNGFGYPQYVNNSSSKASSYNIYDDDAAIRQDEISGTDLPDTDPLWVNQATGDLHLATASPARALVPAPAAYATYLTDYGIDIAYDYDGAPRPESGNWDAGAFQYSAEAIPNPGTATATGITAGTVTITP